MKRFITLLLLLVAVLSTSAQQRTNNAPTSKKARTPRIDRNINSNPFVLKGESMIGLTASYGTLASEDSDLALIIDNINLNGTIFTIKPYYAYTYRDNHAIGVRLGYNYSDGKIDSAGLNLGESNDINMTISNMAYNNSSYSAAIFHRSYMSLDKKGHFGLFAEWELSGTMGRSEFGYEADGKNNVGISDSYHIALSFAPGLAIYIFPNVCASVSVGLGGLQYKHIRQMDAEFNYTGKRDFSKLQFGLNLAQINLGVNIHLWNKKKHK